MYNSALLTIIYGLTTSNPSSSFTVSEGLFNGINLSANGLTVLEANENVLGGLTVDLGASDGTTATISENIYGSQTIEFMDPSIAPIIGRPSIFGEVFTQSGTTFASVEPTFMGDGFHVNTSNGDYRGAVDMFSNMNYTPSAPFNIDTLIPPPYLADVMSFGGIADATAPLDVIDGVMGINGSDFMDFL